MSFIHFDEAKQAAVVAVRKWLRAAPSQVTALLIVDLFGKLRLALWGHAAIENPFDVNLVHDCGTWWTGEVLPVDQADPVAQDVYRSVRLSARPDEEEPRLFIHDRHRSRTAWFAGPINPPWRAPGDGPPLIVFYSFKGGLGRSTLLASFAIQRARAGERVCILDFDLDSPGVGSLLSADALGLTARWGVVDFLLERSRAEAPLADYFHRCDRVAGPGEVVVFPAGHLDEHYGDKLARVDLEETPEAHDSGLWRLLERVRGELKPQWILLDARTGISEPAGLLLSGIAHLHVLLGTTQEQSWQGLRRVLDRLGRQRVLADIPQADVLLVQALVPSGEAGRLARGAYQSRAEREFTDGYYAEAGIADLDDDQFGDTRNQQVDGLIFTGDLDDDRFWDTRDMDSQDAPHVPVALDYDAKLASFADIGEVEVADTLCAGPYLMIAERITGRFATETEI